MTFWGHLYCRLKSRHFQDYPFIGPNWVSHDKHILVGPFPQGYFYSGLTGKSSMHMMMQGKPVLLKGTFNSMILNAFIFLPC